jgi:hypothetical protein
LFFNFIALDPWKSKEPQFPISLKMKTLLVFFLWVAYIFNYIVLY